MLRLFRAAGKLIAEVESKILQGLQELLQRGLEFMLGRLERHFEPLWCAPAITMSSCGQTGCRHKRQLQ